MKIKTAKEAYEATKSRNDLIIGQTLKNISKKIDEAISQGRYSVNIYETLDNEIFGILIEKGYDVKAFYDQKEGDTVTISWGNVEIFD